MAAIRVLFDDQIFVTYRRGGMSRYFAELIREYSSGEAGVEPSTPYRWVVNEHLAHLNPQRFRIARRGPLRRQKVRRVANGGIALGSPRPDIVHHTFYDPRWLKPTDAKRVTTVVDMVPELFPEYAAGMHRSKRDYVASSEAVLCISETTKADLLRLYGDPGVPVEVTHLAAGEELADPRPRLPATPWPYLLFLGNRGWYKNFELALKAFARVATQHRDLHLLCVGGPPLQDDEATAIRERGLAQRVHHTWLSDDDLPAAYQHAEAFLFPSRYEGFGLPVVEAFTAGCPAVVSDIECFREVAADGAVFVGPDDVEATAEAVSRLLVDADHRRRTVELGRAVAARYSWQLTAKRTAEVYRAIL